MKRSPMPRNTTPMKRTAMLRRTASSKCRHCREATSDALRLHQECVEPWYEANREKLAKAKERALKRQAKAERAADKARAEKLKTEGQLTAECRKIAQEYARIRDRHDGCISCHMGANYGGKWQGSHFRPAGNNAAVELNLWNIHKACAQCNLFKGGNIGQYRPRLIAKIGLEKVEWLESQNQPFNRSPEYLAKYKRVIGKRLRRMKKRAA